MTFFELDFSQFMTLVGMALAFGGAIAAVVFGPVLALVGAKYLYEKTRTLPPVEAMIVEMIDELGKDAEGWIHDEGTYRHEDSGVTIKEADGGFIVNDATQFSPFSKGASICARIVANTDELEGQRAELAALDGLTKAYRRMHGE